MRSAVIRSTHRCRGQLASRIQLLLAFFAAFVTFATTAAAQDQPSSPPSTLKDLFDGGAKLLGILTFGDLVRGRGAVVIDGDSLKLNGAVYRLWGIDAPETKQDCSDGWPAGRMATTKLLALVQGKTVVCEKKDTDRYGRTVAICRASGEDLGALLVRSGMAWAFVRYSRDYVEQEARAKLAKVGVHARDCVPAWEWRALQRR